MPIKDSPLVPETGRTTRSARAILLVGFVAAVVLPAALQPVFELSGWFDKADPGTDGAVRDRKLQELELFSLSTARRKPTLLRHIQDYESALEDRSVVSTALQPHVQRLQLALARQGNEKVLVGRDGWLFYRPCVEFVTGKAFGSAALRPNESRARNADPLPAIVKFRDDLKARDIELVLVPVPVKAAIYPERLAGRYDAGLGPPVNRGMKDFYRRLREKGIEVVDLTPVLWEARHREELYLPLDSHWTPGGMRLFAAALAAELKRRFSWLENPSAGYEKRPLGVSNHGDVYDMLRLPPRARPFPATSVTVEQVIDIATAKPVESDEKSPIALLGDSAANIFSAESMRWGAHGGLAEQLCFNLGRPLHWIAVNGGASTEVRRRLAAGGLSGKTLVVWEFIMRDLTHPDPKSGWEEVPLPAEAPEVPLPSRLAVKARVVKTTEPPIPDAAEIYPDTLTHTLYEVQEVLEGDYRAGEVLAVEWVQLKKRPTRAAGYQVGDVHGLVLEPLREARRKQKAVAIAGSVDDVKRPDLPAFWVVQHRQELSRSR